MYAIVRKKPLQARGSESRSHGRIRSRRHAEQPGFRGSLTIDVGERATIVVNLWESRQHAEAALPKMIPIVEQYLEPFLQDHLSFSERDPLDLRT
jgi:hypothetical protein